MSKLKSNLPGIRQVVAACLGAGCALEYPNTTH